LVNRELAIGDLRFVTGRRQFLSVVGVTIGLAPVVAWFARPSAERPERAERFPVEKSDEEWRSALTPAAYYVLRDHGTERPGSSPLNQEKRTGTFTCAACGQPLFHSDTKYESGTGWPSFWKPIDNAVGTTIDRSYFMVRTEVYCARCGSHLGHVFEDGPEPTGLRYCMNGVALAFRPE
jgi:peptide-methionine (R)-S-oxide reductase